VTQRDLGQLGLRLVGILVLIQQLEAVRFLFLGTFFAWEWHGLLLLRIFIGLLLLVLAVPLARVFFHERDTVRLGFTASELLQVGITLIGLWFVVNPLGRIAEEFTRPPKARMVLVGLSAQVVLGLCLTFSARYVTALVGKFSKR
jgi:hypothetical protein